MNRAKKCFWIILLCILLLVCSIAAVSCKDKNEQDQYTIVSAYNKAKELGFTGSLEEFIVTIKGVDGKDGQDGKNGIDGIDGVNGKDGINGQDGINGTDGKDGIGIKSVELNNDGELVITDTNGNIIFIHKLPLCSHDYSDSVVGLAPTCVSAGYNYKICSKCGETQYIVTPALGHSWDQGVVVIEPNCSVNGLMLYSCEDCDLTKSEVVSPTGVHKYQNGVCIYCDMSRAQILDEYYNGNYGYEYLSTLENGNGMTDLYDAIHSRVLQFHANAEADAVVTDGNYILLTVDCADYGLTIDQAVAVWKTYLDDKPLYYWLAKTATVIDSGTIAVCVDEDYAQGSVRAQYNEKLYRLIEKYDLLAQDESAYSVALAFHDKIISGIDYAYKDRNIPEDAAWAHSIVGVFEGKGAVCEGYARAFQLLLNTRKIPNIFVTGQSRNQNHAWNLVEIDNGNWYWYDLTWDDTPHYYWGISHNYLCATDTNFLQNHQFDLPTNSDVNFLYGLPVRATEPYTGDEIMLLDEFVENGAAYTVIGYEIVNISEIEAEGDYVIPETVTYRDHEFKIVSLCDLENGVPSSSSNILSYKFPITSITIPSTIVYIDDHALRSSYLQNIFVDEDNTKFRSLDGVLFTKNLLTLVTYPGASPRSEYTIPDETYYIADWAFDSGKSSELEKLTLGKNVATIGIPNWGRGYPSVVGDYSNVVVGGWNRILTYYFPKTIQLCIDADNPNYKIRDGMLLNLNETILYAGLPGVESVVIPQTVTRVEVSAFERIQSLKSVTFTAPSYIGSAAFESCRSLEQVTLVEGMTEISNSMFTGCFLLKTISIPSTVTSIGYNAFDWCESLETIIIPNGVKSIDRWAFGACFALKTLVIPNSVTTMGKNIFGQVASEYVDTKNLEVYYTGTSDEWNAISKDNTFTEQQLSEMQLYFYCDEQPVDSGNYWHYVDGEITKW